MVADGKSVADLVCSKCRASLVVCVAAGSFVIDIAPDSFEAVVQLVEGFGNVEGVEELVFFAATSWIGLEWARTDC